MRAGVAANGLSPSSKPERWVPHPARMNLYALLKARKAPIRVGLIGCGKFGSMFLAQAQRTPGLHVVGIADKKPDNAKSALSLVGWPDEQHAARSLDEAVSSQSTTYVTDDAMVCSFPRPL